MTEPSPPGVPASPDVTQLIEQARRPAGSRTRAMLLTGVQMMLHDKLKLAGTVFGVVFAVVLSVQQLGVLFGLLAKNTMFVDNAGADVFIAPPNTKFVQPGTLISEQALLAARTTDGVDVASPLVLAGASILLPNGGSEPLTLIGTELPWMLGGPWNVVAGDPKELSLPNAMFFEDSRRKKLGNLNLGSRREVSGHQITVVGFTWGLLPFGPPYSFAEYHFARSLVDLPPGRLHFVLVRTKPGVDPRRVARELSRELPYLQVMTRPEFHRLIVRSLLAEQLGVSFGTSTIFGLVVGFAIVSLLMFSSVVDHIREFGTLKAIGATNRDLSHLLLVQSIVYALAGSLIGLAVATLIGAGIRSPQLVVLIPAWLYGLVPVVMIVICVLAAALALARVRRLEPGVVFRQ